MALINDAGAVRMGANQIDRLYKGVNLIWSASAPTILSSTEDLFDSFDVLDANKWTIFTGASASSGSLVLAASSSYSTIRSISSYSIRYFQVHVEILGLPNVSNGSTQAHFNFRIDVNNLLTFLWENNQLYCRLVVDGSNNDVVVPYDAAAMRVWRLRERDSVLYWETSQDGSVWTEQRSAPLPEAWEDALGLVTIAAGNYANATTPGQAVFDNLNLPPTTTPGTNLLSEPFDTLDAAKWKIYPGATVSSGELVLQASSSYSTIRTIDSYPLTDFSAQVQVLQIPNISNGSTQSFFDFRINVDNMLTFMWTNNQLISRLTFNGVNNDTEIAFDPISMRVWRLRESAGSLHWETSADGSSWTSRKTAAAPSEWVSLPGKITLYSGNYNNANNPGMAKFDNLNLAPNSIPIADTVTEPEPNPTGSVLFQDNFDGPNVSQYVHHSRNGESISAFPWYGEYAERGGQLHADKIGGVLSKTINDRFYRQWTKQAFGGSTGNKIRIRTRVRTTYLANDTSNSIVDGCKLWIKWPHPDDQAYPGPASVRGIVDGTSPGSYIYSFHTQGGVSEIMRRAAGMESSSAYSFFVRKTLPYAVGTWEDIAFEIEWFSDRVRLRGYRNGALNLEANDTDYSKSMRLPGYYGVRSDYARWEMDYFIVESFA